MKTLEEVAAEVKDAKIYSVFYVSNGYWQIRLTKDCQKYTMFNSPLESYKHLRLAFGNKSVSEAFQRTVSKILKNIGGCEVIAVDIWVWGNDSAEHNERLIKPYYKESDRLM